MPTFVTRAFSLNRDFRTVLWPQTLRYNLLRAFCAGIVWAVLMLIFPQPSSDRALALATPFVWPLLYLIFFLPFGLLLLALARAYPVCALFSHFISIIATSIGDPVILALHAWKPAWVGVKDPPVSYFRLIVFLLKPGAATEIVIAT